MDSDAGHVAFPTARASGDTSPIHIGAVGGPLYPATADQPDDVVVAYEVGTCTAYVEDAE